MNKTKIILISGSGHCKSCIDVIEQKQRFQRLFRQRRIRLGENDLNETRVINIPSSVRI